MPGKVFISCGQRPPMERSIAEQVAKILEDKFKLTPYLAFKIQGLKDIMKIVDELKSSDYFLFIDFHREEKGDSLICSMFTHQELALAFHLGFDEVIALQHETVQSTGFLSYIQANPEKFKDEKELLEKIERMVRERKWSKEYSRNLVIAGIHKLGPLSYGDHTGSNVEYAWQARIENKRSDRAAVSTVAILDRIEKNNKPVECIDRTHLKWAGQMGYSRTILPTDFGDIDIFSIRLNQKGIYLHSSRDITPRTPIIDENGNYKLYYKVFSDTFPLLEFVVNLDHATEDAKTDWKINTKAELGSL